MKWTAILEWRRPLCAICRRNGSENSGGGCVMCTVSWIHEDGGYQLFCNRDEKLTRQPASDPQVLYHDGVRFLAPIDADSGGTWLATNEFAVTVCLLNGAQRSIGIPACAPFRLSNKDKKGCLCYRSRGVIVLELATAKSIEEVHD